MLIIFPDIDTVWYDMYSTLIYIWKVISSLLQNYLMLKFYGYPWFLRLSLVYSLVYRLATMAYAY